MYKELESQRKDCTCKISYSIFENSGDTECHNSFSFPENRATLCNTVTSNQQLFIQFPQYQFCMAGSHMPSSEQVQKKEEIEWNPTRHGEAALLQHA